MLRYVCRKKLFVCMNACMLFCCSNNIFCIFPTRTLLTMVNVGKQTGVLQVTNPNGKPIWMKLDWRSLDVVMALLNGLWICFGERFMATQTSSVSTRWYRTAWSICGKTLFASTGNGQRAFPIMAWDSKTWSLPYLLCMQKLIIGHVRYLSCYQSSRGKAKE